MGRNSWKPQQQLCHWFDVTGGIRSPMSVGWWGGMLVEAPATAMPLVRCHRRYQLIHCRWTSGEVILEASATAMPLVCSTAGPLIPMSAGWWGSNSGSLSNNYATGSGHRRYKCSTPGGLVGYTLYTTGNINGKNYFVV